MSTAAPPAPAPARRRRKTTSSSGGRRASPGCCSCPRSRSSPSWRSSRSARRSTRASRTSSSSRPSRASWVGLQNYTRPLARQTSSTRLDDREVHGHHRRLRVPARARVALVVNSNFKGRGDARGHARALGHPDRRLGADVEVDVQRRLRRRQRRVVSKLHVLSARGLHRRPATSFWAVGAVDIWKTTPFMALLLLAGLQVIPDDIYEAAGSTARTRLQQFLRITLPLLVPGHPRHADLPHARRAARLRCVLRHVRQSRRHADDGDLGERISSASPPSATARRSAWRSSWIIALFVVIYLTFQRVVMR